MSDEEEEVEHRFRAALDCRKRRMREKKWSFMYVRRKTDDDDDDEEDMFWSLVFGEEEIIYEKYGQGEKGKW